jgi:hypothetical protein
LKGNTCAKKNLIFENSQSIQFQTSQEHIKIMDRQLTGTTQSKAAEAAPNNANPFADVRLPRKPPPTLRLQSDNFQPAPRSQLPPPAYNFGVPAGTQLEGGYPIMPGKGYESPAAHYYKQRRYNKRRIICFVIAILVMLIIALTIFGAVFHWGNSRFCVRWNDGTTSGDCSANN